MSKMLVMLWCCIGFMLLAGLPGLCGETDGSLKTRAEIDNKYKWNLSAIYQSESDWNKDFSALPGEIDALAGFKGKLHDAAALGKFLSSYDAVRMKFENVIVYADLKFNEDTSNEHFQELRDRVDQLRSDYYTKTVFIKKELSTLTNPDIDNLLAANPKLKVYEFFLRDFARYQPHILSEESEGILAQLGIALEKPKQIFTAFNDNDIVFPAITAPSGESMQLSHGVYAQLLRNPDRELRKRCFENYYQPYNQNKDVLANIYAANLLSDVRYAKLKKYDSALAMHLFPDNVDLKVYKNLIQVVKDNGNLVSRYNRLRIKELNLDRLCFYDMYVPMVKELNQKFTYQEAVDLVKKALAPLGPEYLRLYDKVFASGKVDVMESKGKRSGAFSDGTYTAGGYTFLNFMGTLNDVSTLAHEMGHTLNRDLTISAQPFIYYDNPIFLAEVASTFDECLLYDYLIAHAATREEKKYYINNYIDTIRATFFRQTMFADFELRAHEMAERGEPLTSKTLTETYSSVLREHLGPEMTLDDNLNKEWSRIPHFYSDFYVYKYATCISAAIALEQKVLHGGPEDVQRYLTFLKAGSHKDSLEILKDAGIDMTKPETFQVTARVFGELIDQYEKL